MSSAKVGQVVVLGAEDISLIGGCRERYAGHCSLLLQQLHAEAKATPRIYLCNRVTQQGYVSFLAGRKPQPEWLYEYFAAAHRAVWQRLATSSKTTSRLQASSKLSSDDATIIGTLLVDDDQIAVQIMSALLEQSARKPTFYLPIADATCAEDFLESWRDYLGWLLPTLAPHMAHRSTS